MTGTVANYDLAANLYIGQMWVDLHTGFQEAINNKAYVKHTTRKVLPSPEVTIPCDTKKGAVTLRNDLNMYRAAHRHHLGKDNHPDAQMFEYLIVRNRQLENGSWVVHIEERDRRFRDEEHKIQWHLT